MIKFRNLIGRLCLRLSDYLLEASRRLIVCPDCGRSRFYGKACK